MLQLRRESTATEGPHTPQVAATARADVRTAPCSRRPTDRTAGTGQPGNSGERMRKTKSIPIGEYKKNTRIKSSGFLGGDEFVAYVSDTNKIREIKIYDNVVCGEGKKRILHTRVETPRVRQSS